MNCPGPILKLAYVPIPRKMPNPTSKPLMPGGMWHMRGFYHARCHTRTLRGPYVAVALREFARDKAPAWADALRKHFTI